MKPKHLNKIIWISSQWNAYHLKKKTRNKRRNTYDVNARFLFGIWFYLIWHEMGIKWLRDFIGLVKSFSNYTRLDEKILEDKHGNW